MKTKIKPVNVPDSYLKLIFEFPLRPIRSEGEYDAATRIMERLSVRGEKNLEVGERDYLDALDEFITSYDHKHHVTVAGDAPPLEILKYLLEESETTPTGLKKILACSQPLVSMILNGERELSKGNIRALANHFKVEPGLFL